MSIIITIIDINHFECYSKSLLRGAKRRSHLIKMTLHNTEKEYPCPPGGIFRPFVFRVVSFPAILIVCWAAAFFKSRAAEAWPWNVLLLVAVFVGGIFAAEALVAAYFARYLAPAVYGFLVGAGVNALVQALLNRFQGLTWAFQNPMQFSLGTVLFGFLGSLIFIFHGQKVRKIFASSYPGKEKGSRPRLPAFVVVICSAAIILAAALYISLVAIQREFSGFETTNPLRKPLWFSAAAIILVFLAVVAARKNLLWLVKVFIPGVVVGMVWASVVRDVFEGVYLAYPQFPLAQEVLELLLVLNFCYLGFAWLNRAAIESYKTE